MTPDEQATLLDALLDGSLSEADLLRIEAELTVDAAVRRAYYRRIQLDMLLQREAAGELPSPLATPQRVASWTGKRSLAVLLLAGLAASLLMAMLTTLWNPQSPHSPTYASAPPPQKTDEPTAEGFAVLDGQFEAVWSGQAVDEGDLFPAGELHLASGRIHVELFSGVQMVIEGESRFSIDSPMQVTMQSGRARAHVPEPAQGFRIKTASGDVVDLGTEFSIDVDANGADVHVVDGEVELRPSQSHARRIDKGKTLRLADSGNITAASVEDIELIGPQAFQDLLDQMQLRRRARWLEASQQMANDPRLIAHYQFQPDPTRPRQLSNLAPNSAASDGAIVAAQQTADRWGQSGAALDFSRVGSRVRVAIPGEHHGLTMTCWVKINSLDRWYNSLFLTDGHEVGEPHWQIMDDGRIFFSVKLPPPDSQHSQASTQHIYYSPRAWDESLSGRWIMLSVTYDVDHNQVTHYFNGEPLSQEAIPAGARVESIQVGSASICNWSEPMYRTDATFVLRNLNGSMDDFAMYTGALTDDEIRQLYRAGNPNE